MKEKLYLIFLSKTGELAKTGELVRKPGRVAEEAWLSYLAGLGCTVHSQISEILVELTKELTKQSEPSFVLIHDPWNLGRYIRVPVDLAEKALVLGELP